MRTALIVGAGIGGLAAGLALRRAGWDIRIVERASSARELGFALLLAPNAIAALRRLGVADRVVQGGFAATSAEMRRADGRVLRRFDSGDVQRLLGEPMIVALRQVLHGTLLDAVGRDAIALEHEAVGVEALDTEPTLIVANGLRLTGDVIVGADGVGSAVRKALHPADPPPRKSGLFAVRGVAHGAESHLEGMSGAQYFGRGTEIGVARASVDAVYWYVSIPASQIGSARDPRAIVRRCTHGYDRRLHAVFDATRDEDMRIDELFDREPIDPWGRGAVTLLGDAAHPLLPHAGQGAAQALEDAAVLGTMLSRAGDVRTQLREYERVRAPRTAAIVRLARRNARMGSVQNPLACWMRDAFIRRIPRRVLVDAYAGLNKPIDLG